MAKKEGEQVYNTLVSFLTQLEFSPEDAKKSWKRIVEHKGKLETKLGHPISLMTAVCYYLSDVKKYQYPAYHRIKTARGYKKTITFRWLNRTLFNRRYFDDALQGEMNRVQIYNGYFSVFFIDLENFKKLNDTYDHQAGDLTLKVVADILQNMKRTEGTAWRDGGEELILIFPETEKMNALVIAERIRKKIEEAALDLEGKFFCVLP